MDFFLNIYHLFLYQPVFNALVLLAQVIPGKDFGIAVILLTLGVRGISYPLGAQGVRAQKKLAEIQPKIKEIQEKFKNNREEQTRATFALYKEAKTNPFAMLLPIAIQIPVFIVLYQVFSHGIHIEQFSILYPFVRAPETINATFLGLVRLNEPSLVLAVFAGLLQFVQLKQASPTRVKRKAGEKPDIASLMQKQMPYIFPVVIVWISAKLPSAFALYLIASTVFSLWQYWFIAKREKHAEQRTVANN